MPEIKRCPFCEAVLDEVALMTNVCTGCGGIMGDLGKAALTLELNRGENAVSCELYSREKGSETVIFHPEDFDSSYWDEPTYDEQEIEYPELVVNQRHFDSDGVGKADYKVFSKLGSGGMGEIHEANQQSLGREVAIKILKNSNVGSGSSFDKFRTEASITGNLEHPNIIPIYDLGMDSNERPFYAMKKVNGTPWSEALAGNSLQENIEILLKVCDAVAFAHSKGIIHRDLKPENVMLGEFNEVLVMDWGLAAGVFQGARAPRVTYADAIAGTPAYMAPEMAKGNEKIISYASDIYLLGAILYEVITGEPPHNGKSVRECLANAATNVIAEPWVSSELLKTAMKAMSTEQLDRHTSVRQFQQSIREHYKSVELSTSARKYLSAATKTRSYHDFFRAVFGFKEALEVWPSNDEAKKNLTETLQKFIHLAIENKEKKLAMSLLEESEEDFPELREAIESM